MDRFHPSDESLMFWLTIAVGTYCALLVIVRASL